ncbi:MAG: hypothetical protein Q7U02_04150 [Desulfosalsimonadaceae bacterium]|nr:hypothetical protein [Desulfosalsimonadaceae bacterium]
MVITTTKSGTMIVNGVEYNTYPPPSALVKVMKSRWAKELIAYGNMRFGSLESYREWENAILGDPNDGKGRLHMMGHPYDTDSANPVHAWCSSFPTITADRTLLLAEHGDYDCVVRIRDPLLLIQRVQNILVRSSKEMYLHCSIVSYNRGEEVNKRILNSQKFHFNVFQKDTYFAPDMEYRLSLTDTSLKPKMKPDVILPVGDCSDIITIEDLPNHRVERMRETSRF